MAHHENRARIALDETKQLHLAAENVAAVANLSDTLIIVTSDHSHTMTIGGYPIKTWKQHFGSGRYIYPRRHAILHDKHANGMGYYKHVHANGSRMNSSEMNFSKTEFQYPAGIPLDMESHGGDDVAVYAIGPYSHLFGGTYEQNFIAEAIKYAACIGHNPKSYFCSNGTIASDSKLLRGASLIFIIIYCLRNI